MKNTLLVITVLMSVSISALAQLRPTGGGGLGGGEAILTDQIEELNHKEGWLEELDTPQKIFDELTKTLKRRDRVCGGKLNIEESKNSMEIFYKISIYHAQKKKLNPNECEAIDAYLGCLPSKSLIEILQHIKKHQETNTQFLSKEYEISKKDATHVISKLEKMLVPEK